MKYIEFDNSKKYDLILLGRVAVDLNPVDYYCPLNESTTFKRYLGGSPANIAVGLARLAHVQTLASCGARRQRSAGCLGRTGF